MSFAFGITEKKKEHWFTTETLTGEVSLETGEISKTDSKKISYYQKMKFYAD